MHAKHYLLILLW